MAAAHPQFEPAPFDKEIEAPDVTLISGDLAVDQSVDPHVEVLVAERTESRATATDPVCGMRVDPASDVAHVEHAGVTHFFCSTSCRETFVNSRAGQTAESNTPAE